MNKKELQKSMNEVLGKADERLLRMLLAVSREYELGQPKSDRNKPRLEVSQPGVTSNDQLYRLVYTSARSSSCDDSCIDSILEAAARNNPALGLTGILIHTPKRFLQVLEGPLDNVTKLYEKIEQDPRHGGSQMRYCQPASERHFGNWHMAHKRINSRDVDFETSVSNEEQQLYAELMDGNLHDYKDEGMRVLKTFLMVS